MNILESHLSACPHAIYVYEIVYLALFNIKRLKRMCISINPRTLILKSGKLIQWNITGQRLIRVFL